MNIYIVEDEVFHLEDIQISLEELGYNSVGHTDDPFEAQEQILTGNIDVVLMDIHLNGREAGVKLAECLKKRKDIPIIFTSSEKNDKIMEAAANLAPIAYLTKPVKKDDLKAALILAASKNKTIKELEVANDLFVKHGNKLVRVEMNEIILVHTDTKNYCTLITKDNRKLTFRNSIQAFYKLLDPHLFIQTHRAYLVNFKAIDAYLESDQMLSVKDYSVPVGRTFKAALLERMNIL